MTICGVCGGKAPVAHVVPERMFGMGGQFEYGRCVKCGALTLVDPPADLAPFYASGYYAHRGVGRLREAVGRAVRQSALPEWLAGVDRDARVLDVGSGTGTLLRQMGAAGFTRLEGVDPLVDTVRSGSLTIHGCELSDLDGEYDFVMSHHSLEHVHDPTATLCEMRRLLSDEGRLLLRTPVADSWTYEHYGSDWWALDAPRHLHVFTTRAIEIMASRAGLVVVDAARDGNAMQFYACELYRRGETLNGRGLRDLSRATRQEYERRAAELNANGTGDFGLFWFTGCPDL
jgi:SAM-dependent methyltransferase